MTGPLVAVGIGNTTLKLGVTREVPQQGRPQWSLCREFPTATFDPSAVAAELSPLPHIWLVASVQRAAQKRLGQWLQQNRPQDHFHILTYRDLPIGMNVEEPDVVGMDRVAAAAAANKLRDPQRAAIVVDAGTAITVNLISADGVFQGGVILPGFRLTAQALAHGTDLLPLVAPDINEPPPVVGKSTQSAIRSGLFWGNLGAVRELVSRIAADLPSPPAIFVTGGDARRLAGFIASDAQFIPDLVLTGILLAAPEITGLG